MSHLYACLFSTGIVKVGRAKAPLIRISQHVERVACLGVTLVEMRIVAVTGDVHMAETAVLTRCRAAASQQFKREWFDGLPFSLVCEYLEEEAARGHQRVQVSCQPSTQCVVPAGVDQRFQCTWEDGKHVWVDAAPHDVLWPEALMRWDLRQSDWHLIWPELIDHPCAKFFAPIHPLREGPPSFEDWVRSWPSSQAGACAFDSMSDSAKQIVQDIWPELDKPARKAKPTTEAKEAAHG